jgi:hypothetical protein
MRFHLSPPLILRISRTNAAWHSSCSIAIEVAKSTTPPKALHGMEWIMGLIDARAPKPGPRGPSKKQDEN